MKLYELFENIMNPETALIRDVQTYLMQIKSNTDGEDKAPINAITQYLNQKSSNNYTDQDTEKLLGNLPMVTGLEDDMVYFGDDFEKTSSEEDATGMTDEEEKDVVSDLAKKSR